MRAELRAPHGVPPTTRCPLPSHRFSSTRVGALSDGSRPFASVTIAHQHRLRSIRPAPPAPLPPSSCSSSTSRRARDEAGDRIECISSSPPPIPPQATHPVQLVPPATAACGSRCSRARISPPSASCISGISASSPPQYSVTTFGHAHTRSRMAVFTFPSLWIASSTLLANSSSILIILRARFRHSQERGCLNLTSVSRRAILPIIARLRSSSRLHRVGKA